MRVFTDRAKSQASEARTTRLLTGPDLALPSCTEKEIEAYVAMRDQEAQIAAAFGGISEDEVDTRKAAAAVDAKMIETEEKEHAAREKKVKSWEDKAHIALFGKKRNT